VPGKVLAQLMGPAFALPRFGGARHANVDTTLNVYTQVLDGSARAAADRIGSELFTIVHTQESVEPVDG
jgi:hypothetical protein